MCCSRSVYSLLLNHATRKGRGYRESDERMSDVQSSSVFRVHDFSDSGRLVRRVSAVIDVLMWPTECVPGVLLCQREEEWCPSLCISVGHLSFPFDLRCNIAFWRCPIYTIGGGIVWIPGRRKKYVIMQLSFLWDFLYCSRRRGYTNRDREGSLFSFCLFIFWRYYKLPHHLSRQKEDWANGGDPERF